MDEENFIWTIRMDADTVRVWQQYVLQCAKSGTYPNKSDLVRKAFREKLSNIINDKKYLEKLKLISQIEEQESEHRLLMREGSLVLKKETFIPYLKNYFSTRVIGQDISEVRKYRIYQVFLKTGLQYKYTKKEIDKALGQIGFRSQNIKKIKK